MQNFLEWSARLDLTVSPSLQRHQGRCRCHRGHDTAHPMINRPIAFERLCAAWKRNGNARKGLSRLDELHATPFRRVLDDRPDQAQTFGRCALQQVEKGTLA